MALPIALPLAFEAPSPGLDQAELPVAETALLGLGKRKERALPLRYTGEERTELPILRPGPGGPRIFVQAVLPDGSKGVFLVDTGADVSVLTDAAAERLGLTGHREVDVWGLSGSASVQAVLLPELKLGEVAVSDIDVLVGVPGFQDRIGFMPVDGLLGNNVWSRFTLEIDYPADTMVLSPPGTGPGPRRSAPMFYDGSHVHTLVTVTTAGDKPKSVDVITQVDTGASELTLCAATGLPFAGEFTQGLETVRGIGASETLPPFRFLEMTRRIPVDKVELGSRTINVKIPARWVAYENTRTNTCGNGGMKALLGHEYLRGHRVIFDYGSGRIALLKSHRKPRQLDGHAVLLSEEVRKNGQAPERGLVRGRLLIGMGQDKAAVESLKAFIASGTGSSEEQAEGRVLLSQLLRHLGEHEEAWKMLGTMSAGDLVDQDQIVGTVNGLMFEEQAEEAHQLALRGVAERPDKGWSHVALADVLTRMGRQAEAQAELLVAADLEQYPDAHLLRRARVALATGDRYGAMAHIRKLLELYPGGGPYLWFYAMLVETDGERETFRSDVEGAMARLHPHNRPLDFLVAAHRALGDEDKVQKHLSEGLAAHCEPMPEGPEKDNCTAWYYALAQVSPDESLQLIQRALEKTGERSDFLDTKAMVHLARAEYDQALAAAHEAARLSPDDVYMLWQAERIAQIAQAGRAGARDGASLAPDAIETAGPAMANTPALLVPGGASHSGADPE